MKKMKNNFDLGGKLVIGLTFLLFTIAFFTKGLTEELLLEAGVLLVSIKLIMMSFKNSILNKKLLEKLDEIESKIDKI
jgi:hypothetical protein